MDTSSLDTAYEALERSRRALAALYAIAMASRGQTELRPIFEIIASELALLFQYDACYIAVCDPDRPGFFQAALLIDEALVDYEEQTTYGTLTSLLIEQQVPLLFRDLQLEAGNINRSQGMFGDTQKFSQAWLGVPLLLGSQAIGVVSLQSYTANVYNEADLSLLQQIGNLAGVVIENTVLALSQQKLSIALADQVQQRIYELDALGRVAAEMVRRQPLQTLLDQVTHLAASLFMVDGAVVRLLDIQRSELQLASKYGIDDNDTSITQSISLYDTFTGRAITENRPILISGDNAHMLEERGIPYKSLLTVPLRIGDLIIGGMTFLTKEGYVYDNQRVQAVMALANQIAITIENARLFAERERRVHELTAMSSIAQATSTAVDQVTVLWRVYTALSNFLPIDSFAMVIYDAQRKIVNDGLSIEAGQEHHYLRKQPLPTDSLTNWVLTNRTTLRFSDLDSEIANYPKLSHQHLVGTRQRSASWLGAPMIGPTGEPIGAISVQSYSTHAFNDHDEQFLVGVASQVALIIQNVILIERHMRRIRELDAIEQISRLISMAFSLDDMLPPIYKVLEQLTEASSFFIILCDPENHHVTHAFYIDGGERIEYEIVGRPLPPGSLSTWILEHSLPLLFDDISTQDEVLLRLGIQPYRYGSDSVPQSWAGVPLFNANAQSIGVIAIQDFRSYQYDRQTIEFLHQIASHLSLGVQKVELFAAEKAARRAADTLREVARVLNTTLDPDEVLEVILGELQHVVSYDTASIMLLENRGLRIVAVRGWQEPEKIRGFFFSLTEVSLATQVASKQQPIIVDDTRNHPNWHSGSVGSHIRSWLGVPLITKGRVLGVLNVDSLEPSHFVLKDAELVQVFANQAAVAIESARLYAESKSRVEQELMIARQIQRNLFPHSLPKIEKLNIAARCIPAHETGGDFYDCFELPGNAQLLAVLIGDASGKSVPAAMLMAVARSVARSEARDHILPEIVMRETNQLMVKDVPSGSFVAMSYATIDVQQRKLVLSNAGQLSPLRICADGRLEYLELSGPTLPLGIHDDICYQSLEVRLEPGDTLLMYTDGVVEAQQMDRNLFGFERLEELLQKHRQLKPEQLIDQIVHEVGLFTSPAQPHDDMTIMVVQFDA